MRGINKQFIEDLKTGELSFFLHKVKSMGDSLSIEIRNGYVNIYYRGGNLLKIVQKRKGYAFHFDSRYCLNKKDTSFHDLFSSLQSTDIESYINYFDLMLSEMDSWFIEHPKKEREYQHGILISNPNILDIEYQINYRDEENNPKAMRFDMIMLADDSIIIAENKYGNGAVCGSAGLSKHYKDICAVLSNEALHDELLSSIKNITENKKDLGLIDFDVPQLSRDKTKILFVLADYNRKSETMKNEIALMNKTVPAQIIFTDTKEYIIDLTKAKDLFCI